MEPFGAPHGKIARGELIRKLWKALRWEEIEQHTVLDPVRMMSRLLQELTDEESSAPACHSPFQLLIPHVCSPESGSPPPASSPPPPKRPDAFPAEQTLRDSSVIADNDEHNSLTPRESEATSPLAIGKGKRKSVGDPPLTNKAADGLRSGRTSSPRYTPTDSSAPSADTSTPKRMRDDDRRRIKQDETKDASNAKSSSRGIKSSGIAGLDATEGSSWTEHRDAVRFLAENCVADP